MSSIGLAFSEKIGCSTAVTHQCRQRALTIDNSELSRFSDFSHYRALSFCRKARLHCMRA